VKHMNPEETLQFKELCIEIIGEREEARYPYLLRRLEAMGDKRMSEKDVPNTAERYPEAS
jgi:hypothetical protein